MFVVTKFGGSSLSCAKQFKKVRDIVLSDPMRKIVVVSALGKRDANDSKITDLLYILHAHLKYSVPYEDVWKIIYDRYVEVRDDLKLDYKIEDELDLIAGQLDKNIPQDYLVSRGEFLAAKLMSRYLGYEFLDAKDVIEFNYDGTVNFDATGRKTKEKVAQLKKVVVPGFYGAYGNGVIKLFSRGGSDITGSIMAKCVNATVYENWTDVSGIMVTDPRIVKNPKSIKEITYNELRELSYMGANVLHEDSIFPVQELNIPIKILNTNEPECPGTIISNECKDNSQAITGIAGKKNFVAITVYKDHMSNEVGFLRKCLSIFEKYDISIEHVPTGIDNLSIVVARDQVEKCLYELVVDLKQELGAEVTLWEDIALIAVVGRNMAHKCGLCGKLLSVLGENGVNMKMIDQGPDELNIILGINNCDYEKAIKVIYDNLM
ncbi:MAG TPA: aspartate kinase [Firmicutes bacterium]|nr:aspartate kinase [Bacillota bacterium]